MSLEQVLAHLRQAWMVQRQQFQVVLGALCVLVCLVCWEKSQWTQPARSDLLHNLPMSAHPANFSTSDNSDPDGSHSGSTNAWSCKHSNAWFQGQEHRWPELEDLADTYCQLELASEPGSADDVTVHSGLQQKTHQKMPDLIQRLQDKLTIASAQLADARQSIHVLCEHAAAADPTTAAICQEVASLKASGVTSHDSVNHPLKADPQASSTRENSTLGSMASFREYSDAHPYKAVLGLTGIMSCPRFTTVVLWLLGHEFQMANVKQVILHTAEGAAPYARAGLQVLRCPFFGMILFLCMPGFQTEMYAAAFRGQQPYLALWVGLVGLVKMGVEGWALHTCLTSPMPQSEKLSSAICSHVLLTGVNVIMGVVYVCAQSSLPAALSDLLYFVFITVMPLFTVWAGAAVWIPRLDHAQPRHHQVAHRERRGRDVFALAAAALENHRVIMQNHGGQAVGGPAADPNTAPHRHRDVHRHKEVHWPPPLLVPDHLEDSPNVPDSFKCPITFAIMKEPATTRNGLTYDRPAIMKWIEQHRRDPTTSLKLKAHHLSPNLSLRSVIQNWVDMQS